MARSSAGYAFINGFGLFWLGAELFSFNRCLRGFEQVQRQKLLQYLHVNRETAFGRAHRFDRIRTIAEFRQQVPVMSYEEYRPWIERIARGESNVLTSEKVLLLEPTGGSSGGTKLIPYTATLKAEFQRAVNPWIAGLYAAQLLRPGTSVPRLSGGPLHGVK